MQLAPAMYYCPAAGETTVNSAWRLMSFTLKWWSFCWYLAFAHVKRVFVCCFGDNRCFYVGYVPLWCAFRLETHVRCSYPGQTYTAAI